ncbi:N-formylglutamate amidohydrolase [uncultured Boseongicola sp.]|jgi:predicted N-formylglutamate amidohydrolase|uniref:N-formylglutamate amidohydrolase n=1 Tax=uncultured Boseongicola sp. TaxID=1648499 RepID=UPI002625B649|nr:N-formylglutamate amidohydrolase [uncultured Boseongicola sp.]
MNHLDRPLNETIVDVRNAQALSSVVVVCEHASAYIPGEFENLGLADEMLYSHVAWDPGAMALAEGMAERLDAILIAAKTSRLVYDCNRPPHAPDAMPARSEIVDVPGNISLSAAQKAERVKKYYEPFYSTVAETMAGIADPILVTVHSFTPIFHGNVRDVEIGILHDSDSRLADALLSTSSANTPRTVRRNEPYGPTDGVTHTLKEHALPSGHLNVMLEVRNDLIATEVAQASMAKMISKWLECALATTVAKRC